MTKKEAQKHLEKLARRRGRYAERELQKLMDRCGDTSDCCCDLCRSGAWDEFKGPGTRPAAEWLGFVRRWRCGQKKATRLRREWSDFLDKVEGKAAPEVAPTPRPEQMPLFAPPPAPPVPTARERAEIDQILANLGELGKKLDDAMNLPVPRTGQRADVAFCRAWANRIAKYLEER